MVQCASRRADRTPCASCCHNPSISTGHGGALSDASVVETDSRGPAYRRWLLSWTTTRTCAEAFERPLRSAGISVRTFVSGTTFLHAVRAYKPDCVVVDLHMPGIDGFEVLLRLARDHAGLPVIVMTGHDTPESRSRALAGGARSYLCKPIDDEVLLTAISAAIGP